MDAELPISVEELNAFFATASTNDNYQQPQLKTTVMPNSYICNAMTTFFILDRLRPTAEGLDMIPAWFLRLMAPHCSEWIARLFNISLSSSKIPDQWRIARIRPIPKTNPPVSPSDRSPWFRSFR